MFGIVYLILGAVVLVGGFFRKSIRDVGSKVDNKTSFPFWVDSTGAYRWKSNNEKIMNVTWNNEGHMIITDKNFNNINWTLRNIEQKLRINPNLIIQYGKDLHEKEKVPGVRYITKVNGQYKFYVSIHYGKMHYYMDTVTEKIVMPVPECVQDEVDARDMGYEYCSKEEMSQGINKLNAMRTIDRRDYIDYRGVPKTRFKNSQFRDMRKKKGEI